MRKKDEKFYQTLLNTDLITPDGIGVVKASGMLGTPLKERVAGFDLMCNLLAKLSEDSKPVSVFLLGAKPHVVQAAADRLTRHIQLYPSLVYKMVILNKKTKRILFLAFKKQNQIYYLLHLVSRDKRTLSKTISIV